MFQQGHALLRSLAAYLELTISGVEPKAGKEGDVVVITFPARTGLPKQGLLMSCRKMVRLGIFGHAKHG